MKIRRHGIGDPRLLDHILDHITSAVFMVNEDAEIQSYNKSFGKLFNADQKELIGSLVGDIIRCNYPEGIGGCGFMPKCQMCDIRNSIKKTIVSRETFENLYIAHDVWSKGTTTKRYFKISTKAIDFEGFNLALVILDDITELETNKIQLEEQNQKLQEMNELKNRFLGIAAHDLRNPIAAIQGCASILYRTIDNSSREDLIQLLDIIVEKSKFSLDLIHDLLDIAKIESGNIDLNLEDQNYASLLSASTELYRLMADYKNLNLELNIAGQLPNFKFDKSKIEQVLNNLIDNAIKYSHEGTKITIEAFQDNAFVVTRIIDEGYGIQEHELPNIFKPFHRAYGGPSDKRNSTGLGLAIVKKIVEGHEGEIWVESEVGKGSVFSYRLPVV